MEPKPTPSLKPLRHAMLDALSTLEKSCSAAELWSALPPSIRVEYVRGRAWPVFYMNSIKARINCERMLRAYVRGLRECMPHWQGESLVTLETDSVMFNVLDSLRIQVGLAGARQITPFPQNLLQLLDKRPSELGVSGLATLESYVPQHAAAFDAVERVEDIAVECLDGLLGSNAVHGLPGWQEDPASCIEFTIAEWAGKEIVGGQTNVDDDRRTLTEDDSGTRKTRQNDGPPQEPAAPATVVFQYDKGELRLNGEVVPLKDAAVNLLKALALQYKSYGSDHCLAREERIGDAAAESCFKSLKRAVKDDRWRLVVVCVKGRGLRWNPTATLRGASIRDITVDPESVNAARHTR